jgi:hypothetical protein
MRQRGAPVASFAAAAGIILAGFVICLAFDWPGHLSYDSVIQLAEGRTARYANWHPAVMSWLLGVFDAVVTGTALFMVFDALLFFGSLFGLLLTWPRPHWAAAAVAALWVLSPQLLIYQGTIWKDVLFADAAVSGFVCLALAGAVWSRVRLRFGLIGAALLLFALAALARQNGAIVLVVGAFGLGWLAANEAATGKWRRAALFGGGGLLVALALTFAGMAALATRSVGDSGPSVQLQLLQTYDVIGAVVKEPGLPLDYVHDDDESLEHIIRTTGVRVWTPTRNDTLGNTPALQSALDDANPGTMGAQWRELVLHHPWLYLRVRADIFRWVFLTPDLKLCLPYDLGVDGPSSVLAELGLKERWDARDHALDVYARAFVGTPILSHAFFALLGLIALYILVRRRRPPDIAVASLLLAAFAVTSSFFFISIACDYRYLYFLDISAMLAMFYVALDVKSAWEVLKRPLRRP